MDDPARVIVVTFAPVSVLVKPPGPTTVPRNRSVLRQARLTTLLNVMAPSNVLALPPRVPVPNVQSPLSVTLTLAGKSRPGVTLLNVPPLIVIDEPTLVPRALELFRPSVPEFSVTPPAN